MKIGVFSDTHDSLQDVEKAIKLFQKEKVQLILHYGDWVAPFVPDFIYSLIPKLGIPIKSVFGNNEGDHFSFLKRREKEGWDIEFTKNTLTLELEGKKLAVYHGTDNTITQALIFSKKYDAVFTGHTHIAVIEHLAGTLHVNPGTTSGYIEGRVTDNAIAAIYDTLKKRGGIAKL